MIPRIGSLLTALALFLASAALADAQTLVGQKAKTPQPKEQVLALTTGYLADPVKQDDGKVSHFIRLQVTLDVKGAGKGTMEFDPNLGKYNEFGDSVGPLTEIATRTIEITLKQVKMDDPLVPPGASPPASAPSTILNQLKLDDPLGRRLYEIQGQRWSLVVAPEPTGHRLLWKDKEGKTQRVLPLAVVGKTEKLTKPCHPGCFPARTNILTPDGARAIETIRAGHQILAVDKQGKPCPARVRSVFVSQAALVEVETESGRLTTTGKQPLCLSGGTCKTAEDLMPGEELLRWQDGTGRPTRIRAVHKTNKLAQVFNLVLEDQEYFIAGDFVVRSKPPALAEATGAVAPEQGRKPE